MSHIAHPQKSAGCLQQHARECVHTLTARSATCPIAPFLSPQPPSPCRWWNQHDDRGNDPPSGQQQRGGGYNTDEYGAAGYGSSSSRGNSSAAPAAASGWSNPAPYHQQGGPVGYGAPQAAAGSGYGQQGGSGYGQAAAGGAGGGYGQQQAASYQQQQPSTGSALNPEADPYQSAAPVSRVCPAACFWR